MPEAIRLENIIAPVFHNIHCSIRENEYSSYWLNGGRGSTKSSFAAIETILGIISDPNANALVVRKVGDTIRTSVLTTLLWAIDRLGASHLFKHTKAPAEITYIPTGQKIIMKGLDDPLKLKSIKVTKGYFKILWFEELAEFDGMEEIRNVEQSVLRGGDKFIEICTYNPPNDPNSWVNKESLMPVDDRHVHTSSYLDVPSHWLGDKFLRDAETLKKNDRLKYDHEYMGLPVGRAEQIIFHGKWEEMDFNTPQTQELYQSRFFYGADWGFANDPTALTRSFIIQENGGTDLYIDYETGGVGIEIEELPQLFNSMPDIKRWQVYADCARPETISFMANKGYRISAAPKWSGSVEDGVEYIRSFRRIYIHPRCKNTIEEFRKYSYKVDKNTQEILPVIIDKHNHYIDSIRYSLADYITREVSVFDVL